MMHRIVCDMVHNQPALFDCIGESDVQDVVEDSFALLNNIIIIIIINDNNDNNNNDINDNNNDNTNKNNNMYYYDADADA